MAASHIIKQSTVYKMLCDRVKRDLDWWQEVFLMAAGCLKTAPLNVSNMIEKILPRETKDSSITPEHSRYARFAALALAETDFTACLENEKKDNEDGQFLRTLKRVQRLLVKSLEANETLSPIERVESGRSLGIIGDPRKEIMTLKHMKFCLVPAGDFYMADDLNHCLKYYDYWISKHPVTNAQYEAFVKAGGYSEKHYWKEAEKERYWRDGKFRGYNDKKIRNSPYNYKSPFNLSNHPVVGISWYEALAFTRWITNSWQNNGIIDKNRLIRLPSEAEWEKASRGGLKIPEKKKIIRACDKLWESRVKTKPNPYPERDYPWNDEIDVNKANYDETDIYTTSAAGCFSLGASPYGCMDMSGNIWEWTRSLYKPYPYKPDKERENEAAGRDTLRAARGGAFFEYYGRVWCGIREWEYPDRQLCIKGFRVICASKLKSKKN